MTTPLSNMSPRQMEKLSADWNDLVTGIIRKAKGLKESDSVDLPTGETGHYVKYALDRFGRLATPRPRGRIKPHRKPSAIEYAKIASSLLQHALGVAFQKAVEDTKTKGEDETKITPITPEIYSLAESHAAKEAARRIRMSRRASKKAARRRADTSRRINAGLIPGNADRRSHAEIK